MTEAVADTYWLEPEDLYLTVADSVERDRPVFQGDVFHSVPLPQLPGEAPASGPVVINFELSLCMVVPHPCQCYHGDKVRPRLTVAPVTEVPNYDNFRADRSGAKDKFALPDLHIPQPGGSWEQASHVADLGRLTTINNRWLELGNRVACLSHQGLGLLAKRVLGFQLRYPITLSNAMAYTAAEWNQAYLMQAWVRRHRRLEGFSAWLRDPQLIPGVANGVPISPAEVCAGALDALLSLIGEDEIIEPL